ncbi:hypothetical protein [Actinomyces trachealis]|nr:hypothetical protein [Actinomyces trachealis]
MISRGCEPLSIPTAGAVAEPVTFATARGDDADPALDEMRRADSA